MFTKIERVQVDQNTTPRSTENKTQYQSTEPSMTFGQSSSGTKFSPVLPKIASSNDSIVQANYTSDLTPSPDGETFMEADLTSPVTGKRVRFSQPLEFWREFDRDSGHLLDENGNREESTSVQKTEENLHEQARSNYEAKEAKKLNECREKRRGKARVVRTITEAVENLKLEDEKTSVRKFIAHYKRSTARDSSLQLNKPIQRRNVSGLFAEGRNKPADSVITGSHQNDKTMPLCKLCNFSRSNSTRHSKDIHQDCCSAAWDLKQLKPRSSSLPSLQCLPGSKLFEERLLPGAAHDDKCTINDRAKYGCYGTGFRGDMSITQLSHTPFIVQLFD